MFTCTKILKPIILHRHVCIVFLPSQPIYSNVLGKLRIRDSNNREIAIGAGIWQKYNRHMTVKDQIYE
jgi:hypothetical protein